MNDLIERHTNFRISQQIYYLHMGHGAYSRESKYREIRDIEKRIKDRINKYKMRGFKIDIMDNRLKSITVT